jgi:putative ABC transport system permease protein
MKQVSYLLAVFSVALRRLWHQRGLGFSMLLGLVTAVAVAVSIPIYADAISYRILNDRLYADAEETGPPFSFLFRYVGSWSGYLEWEDTRKVDDYVTTWASPMLGLPERLLVRHFKTDRMRLFPSGNVAYQDPSRPLAYVSLGFISGLEEHIDLIDGAYPRPVANNTDPIEVLISPKLVEELGMQVGEEYIVYYPEPLVQEGAVQTIFQHPVRIAGVWRAADPDEDFWFYRQAAFDEVFLLPEASYVQMSQGMRGEVGLALWSLIADGDDVRSTDVNPLLVRIAILRNKISSLLQNIDIARSPEDQLMNYSRTVLFLTVSLYVFSVPILGIVLYFISLISGMIVQRQRNEVAMLRSRGTTTAQVVGIYVLEGLIIGGLSIVLGSLVGERMAQVMGLTRSFLVLENRPFLPTTLAWSSLRYGLIALVVSLLASVVPAINASRDTVVTYKQEQARSMRAPLWQRAFFDLMMLVPALYGYYLLDQRGTISFLETSGESGSPFSNPYLFVVPMLLLFGLSLVCIRVFPWVMNVLAWLANAWRGVVPVLALRHLSRTARHYVGPMLLLILTLSLAVFTASMALTLDEHIVDRVYYDVGSDFRLVELGESTQTGFGGFGGAPATEEEEDAGPEWLFLPVSEHENIPGVRRAARVWSREVNARMGGGYVKGILIGVDRIDFTEVGFFRRDFAPATLGALMNALAVRDDAVLVSRQIMNDYQLGVGDQIEIAIPVGSAPKVNFRVAGVIDYFPRLYPEDGGFFIGNLDFIFNSVGGMYPYDVWVRTDPSLTEEALLDGAKSLGITVMRANSARGIIDEEQLKPERQGVFGLLSVGFMAAAFLTVLGFLIYSFVSFTQRYIELGVLRAIGLSVGQMGVFLVAEQLTLVATGALAGTALGVLVSRLFIPFFQVQTGAHPFTPPFVVQIAWQEIVYIYVVFGAMFVLAVFALLLSLRRMRVFEAIKLGETT